VGINYRARKARNEAEWLAALNKLTCDIPTTSPNPQSIFDADRFYDAGDAGCGDGPLDEIAALLHQLKSGQTVEVRSTDPTVAVDLPAWSRLSGHKLIAQQEDRYLLKRK